MVENTSSLQIESVAVAFQNNLHMCVLEGSTADILVTRAHPTAKLVRKDISEGMKEVFLGVTRGECILALTTAGSWDVFQHRKAINGACKMVWVGRTFKFRQGGFATLSDSGTFCTSLVRDVLNLHLREMKEDGTLDRAWKKYVTSQADIDCDAASSKIDGNNADESSHRLSLQDMGGLFIFFYFLTATAILMALFAKWNKKKNMCRRRGARDSSSVDKQATPPADESFNAATESATEQLVIVRQQLAEMLSMLDNKEGSNQIELAD